jgi:hypothetical protein
MVSNLQCLKAELRADVPNVISMVLLMDGEEKHYDVPFNRMAESVVGFVFPVEVRPILRLYKEPSDLLLRLSTRVANGLPVTLPMTLLDLAVNGQEESLRHD